MSLPVAVTLSQPLFSVNHLKWNRRIEPLRYREAQARFLTETEQVAMQAISLYFGLLLAGEPPSARTMCCNYASTYSPPAVP